LEFAGRKVRGGDGFDVIFLQAGFVGVPFAGEQNFHFAINDFHGDGALIIGTGEAFFGGEGIGERKKSRGEQSHGDEEFGGEGAEFGTSALTTSMKIWAANPGWFGRNPFRV
jgi:hypothetical protein